MRQLVARLFSVYILAFHWEECKRWAEQEAFDFCYHKLTKYSFVSSYVTLTTKVSHLSSVKVATVSVALAEVSQSQTRWTPYKARLLLTPIPLQHQCQSEQGEGSLQGLPFTCVNRILWVTRVVFSFLNFFAWTVLSQIPASSRSPARASGHLDSWESNRKLVLGVKQAAVSNQTFKKRSRLCNTRT